MRIVFGTSAELIKLRPIIVELQRRGVELQILCTGQQYSELTEFSYFKALEESDIPIYWVAKGYRGRSLTKARQVVPWLLAVFKWTISSHKMLKKQGQASAFIVHGDTMTTVVGALMGRVYRHTVVHVEAGLRSGDWFNPFPEELNRIITSKLARVHFAPDMVSHSNLSRTRGHVICTHGNTSLDVLVNELNTDIDNVLQGSVLVLLHRSELLNNPQVLQETLSALIEIAQHRSQILIVLDAFARTTMEQSNNFQELVRQPKVKITGKLDHTDFVRELLRSELVITDSGGVQEEAAALGIPCIVHRKVSERADGLGEKGSVVLTGLDRAKLVDLSVNPPSRRRRIEFLASPTKIICDSLIRFGIIPNSN